jgi:methylglyoxal synthase
MKKLLLLALIAFLPLWANAQKGISYQAVILDPNPIEIPGKDIVGQPFVNGSVWVKFALLSGSVTQFQEVHQTTTDGYGLVNLTIGSVANTAFNSLVWDSNQKTLQVYVSFNQGASYTKVSDQKLLYTPYSLYADTAGKLSGILGITGGGTGASTAVGARANLGLGNVDNTADTDKPISTAAQSALNLKVDKVAGERLINAVEITKLSNQSGVNTGDQDLSSFATTSAVDAALALKAPLASPSFTGSPSTPTAIQGTNSTQIASTEFVTKAIDVNSKNSQLIYVPFSGANKSLNLGLYDLTVNDLTVGKGSGQKITNTAVGRQSLWANSSGLDNTALGANTLLFNQTGNYNTASGYQALQSNTTGNSNTAFGAAGLITNTTGSKLTAIGTGANVTMDGLVNSTAIGFGANVSTSNTIQLGNSEISSVKTNGKITSGEITYPNTNGASGQVLTANTNGSATWNTLPPPAASALIGTVAIVNGGTGATNMVGARANLGLSNVENTADANKPVSTATQSALDLKVDKVTGERLINSAEITKLGNQSGVNTGDQDLSGLATKNATDAALALKAPLASPSFSGTVSGITKAMVGLGSVDNTTDASKPVSTATQSALDLKVDKVAGQRLINSAEITKLGNQSGVNTGDQDLSSFATTAFVQDAISTNSLTVGSISNDPSPNGAIISSGVLQLTPANIANGGIVTTEQQQFVGQKIFVNNLFANNVSVGMPFTGSQNTMLGEAAFGYAAPGNNNTALGFMTLASISNSGGEGNDNTAVGTNALRQGVTLNGSRNTAIGVNSMGNGSGSYDNVAVGINTLNAATGGSNTAIGNYSLQNTTTARENVGVGFNSLLNSTDGGYNTAIGTNSMFSNTSGDVNTAIGHNSLFSNTIGRYNTAIGVQAQETNLTGNQNTAIGVAAIDRNTNGGNNVALGAFAGRYIGDGQTYNTEINNSVLIGSESKPLYNSSSNEIVIGYNAIGNGSNTIQLGNSNITNVNTSGGLTANASISNEITDNFTIDPTNAEAYKGKIIICNPSNAITITFSSSLPTGFNCMILQKSADANKITIAGGSGVTVKNRNNYTATAGNYALLTVVHIGGNILVTAGDMQ